MCANHQPSLEAILVLVATLLLLSTSAEAQTTMSTSSEVVRAAETPENLASSFEALERAWLDARLGFRGSPAAKQLEFEVDSQRPTDEPYKPSRSRAIDPRPPWARRTSTVASPRPHNAKARLSKALSGSGRALEQFSIQSAASASQAEARQAVVNALARTPLGRALGKVFYIRHDGEDDEPSRAWSRVIPLLSPRLNARSRTVGLTLVWRF